MHAALAFAAEHPWYHADQAAVVLLAVADEDELEQLYDLSCWTGWDCTEFREPDLHGALTAFAAEGKAASRLARYPLALREGVTNR
jgi:hypothetical protein